MDRNEIEKELYRQKPIAKFYYSNRIGENDPDVHYIYTTQLEDGTKLEFWIPEDEVPYPNMDDVEAQLLINWLDI